MTLDIALVLGILLIAVTLFVTEWVRVDVVALLVLAALPITGVLTPEQAVSGFSNPAVITVWAVFIISGGLARTGVAGILGRQIMRVSGSDEWRLVAVIMSVAAALSAFMSNVAVAALLLPVVMDIARRTRRAPSKLLIPLAAATLLGGLLTLIGTPPNLLVSAALTESGFAPFDLFDFTPMGMAIVVAGILYMTLAGRRLLPSRHPAREMASAADEAELEAAYDLEQALFALDVPEGSALVGKTLAESRVGSALGVNVMALERDGRLRLAPDPSVVFRPGDTIVVHGQRDTMAELGGREYLSLESESVPLEELMSEEVQFAEVTVAERSSLIGETLRDVDFRHRFHGCLVLALWRDGAPVRTHLATEELRQGDVLLVHGRRPGIEKLEASPDVEVSLIFDPLVYGIEERLMACSVPDDSPLVGKTLAESRLGDVFSLGIMAIERDGEKSLLPPPFERLQAGDRLVVKGRPEDLITVEGLYDLPVEEEAPELAELESEDVGLAEVVLSPRSTAAGKTLAELHFRERYGLNVLAVMRKGVVHRNLRYLRLEFGDGLIVHGPRIKISLLREERDFLVLTQEGQEPPDTRKAPLAVLLLGGMVAAVILGLAPIHIAAVAAGLVMVVTGCLTMDQAYRSIEWQAVFLIAGMLPLGTALQQTGAVELMAATVVDTAGPLGPVWVVGAVFLLTALGAQIMPTSAIAILAAPLALTAAADLGLSPHALVMTVGLASSASFMSPVAHPSNTLMMGPGGYRFADYVKVGLPLVLVCLLVTVALLPLAWPLTP